jgi:hypothetical protein
MFRTILQDVSGGGSVPVTLLETVLFLFWVLMAVVEMDPEISN